MMKFLIINADDFGWDPDASQAIFELAQQQKISSISVMANLVNDKELGDIKQLSGISVGLHVNLLCGQPVCPVSEVKSLVNQEGFFLTQKQLLLRSFWGRIRKEDVEREVVAQWQRLKEAGIEVSHADSHQHVHQYPFIGRCILNALQKIGVKKVRRCNVLRYSNSKNAVIKFFYIITKYNLTSFFTPDKLVSDFSLYRSASLPIFTDALNMAFRTANVVEFMTHPAKENRSGSYLNRKGEFEFWLLQDIIPYLSQHNIRLVNYNVLGR